MATTTSENEIRADVVKMFGPGLEEDLIAASVKLCQMYDITGETLFYKWEAHRLNQGPSHFSADDIQAIGTTIQRERKTEAMRKMQAKVNMMGPLSRGFGATRGRPGRSDPGLNMKTPGKPMVKVQDGFSLAREQRKVPVAGPSRVDFVGPSTDADARKKRAYHYMYEKVSDRSEAMDDRIDNFGDLIKNYYDVEELGDPSAVTDEDITVVGRIIMDTDVQAGGVKLNEASLVLESSRMMSSGARVPLKFELDVKVRRGMRDAGGLGLFPGAVVALRGKNGGGGWFLVSEILSLPPMPSPPHALVKSEDSETQFSLLVACGPFTPDADLQYKPFRSLVAKLKEVKPAVTLLVGPFVDVAHQLIEAGDLDDTPEDIFRTRIVDPLGEFLDDSPGSIVLMVPSVRDLVSEHAAYPQRELNRALVFDPRIHLLPNPARFSLNGVSFGVTAVDVLFHLRKEEFFKRAVDLEPRGGDAKPENGTGGPDAMANLCRHILQQRSFYPIFPVPQDLSHEVNLDVSHSALLDLDPVADTDVQSAASAPDVLILPSRLKHFSKMVDDTVAVNPSFAAKSLYTVLTYAGHGPGPAKERINVEHARLEG